MVKEGVGIGFLEFLTITRRRTICLVKHWGCKVSWCPLSTSRFGYIICCESLICRHNTYGGFRKWRYPKIYGIWFIMENPIKMDNLGVPLFQETSICIKLDERNSKQSLVPSCSPRRRLGCLFHRQAVGLPGRIILIWQMTEGFCWRTHRRFSSDGSWW